MLSWLIVNRMPCIPVLKTRMIDVVLIVLRSNGYSVMLACCSYEPRLLHIECEVPREVISSPVSILLPPRVAFSVVSHGMRSAKS